ncbi:MAG: hypothetical protein C4316_09820, partial [Chloroflexota bacterium]
EATIAQLRAEVAERERKILEMQRRLNWRRYRLADRIVGSAWEIIRLFGRVVVGASLKIKLPTLKSLAALVLQGWWLLPRSVRVRVLKGRHRLTALARPLISEDLQQYRRVLRSILEASKDVKGVIIYPPTIDWKFMFQRPQQLARALARRGFLFFYCTPNSRTDQVRGFEKVGPNLYLCHVPLEVFGEIQSPVLYVSWAVHHGSIRLLKDPVVIYDCVDDLEVGDVDQADHEAMLRRADLVLATAQKLYDAIKVRRPDVLLCPNAADYDNFVQARHRAHASPPPDLAPVVGGGRLVVGYSGALARWVDYDLLAEVARRLTEATFVLIGCDYDGSLLRSGILGLENVVWLGMKPYEKLVDYIRWFDVGIIPFKLNNITEACSPIKLWEYLAAGKPVVSTDLPMCRGIEGVLIARSTQEFADNILKGAALLNSEEIWRRIDHALRQQTWDARAALIASALEPLLVRRAHGQPKRKPHGLRLPLKSPEIMDKSSR